MVTVKDLEDAIHAGGPGSGRHQEEETWEDLRKKLLSKHKPFNSDGSVNTSIKKDPEFHSNGEWHIQIGNHHHKIYKDPESKNWIESQDTSGKHWLQSILSTGTREEAVKKLVMHHIQKGDLSAAFDPDEQRDDHGRWSKGSFATPVLAPVGQDVQFSMIAAERRIKTVAGQIAEQLGFPKWKIDTTTKDNRVGGYGVELANYNPANGKIEIRTNQFYGDMKRGQVDRLQDTVVHELMHDVWQQVINDKLVKEYNTAWKSGDIAEDGNANIEFRSNQDKYPTLAALHDYISGDGAKMLSESDGVTDYSTWHWSKVVNVWTNQRITQLSLISTPSNTAANETLAEVGMLRARGDKDKVNYLWNDFHDRIMSLYKPARETKTLSSAASTKEIESAGKVFEYIVVRYKDGSTAIVQPDAKIQAGGPGSGRHSTVFHGTTLKNALNIARFGFNPKAQMRKWDPHLVPVDDQRKNYLDHKGATYFAKDHLSARLFGRRNVSDNIRKVGSPDVPYVVMHVSLSKNAVSNPDPTFKDGAVYVKDIVPAKNITKIDVYTPDIVSRKDIFDKAPVSYTREEFLKEYAGNDLVAGGPGSGRHKGPQKEKPKLPAVKPNGKVPSFVDLQKHNTEAVLKERREKEQEKREALQKKGLSVRGKPILSEKAQRAFVNSTRVATKADHDLAEKHEITIAKAISGIKSQDNSPFDVVLHVGNKTFGIEAKAILRQTNDKITQKADAIGRKTAYAQKNKLSGMFTIASDYREPDGKGGFAPTKKNPDVYIREGVGSFRVGNMTKVKGGFKGLSAYFK